MLNTPHASGADAEMSAASLKFFKDIAETRYYTLGRPFAPQPTPDGSAVLFLRSQPRDPSMILYQFTVKTGRVEELLTPSAVLKGADEALSVEERARRERMRMSLRGFTDYRLSRDGAQILLTLSGRLYVVRRADKQVTGLPGEGWIDPRFSPDGRQVAAVRGGDLHLIDIATGRVTALTTGATDTLTHGTAEFVAQEEMDRFAGYWWSPDSSHLAYQETDESGVETLFITHPGQPELPPEAFHYPRAGRDNAKVRLGVIAREGGPTTWVQWDTVKYPYLARVEWEETKAPLTILVQTRDQREEKLLEVDLATGATRELLVETDAAWVNLDRSGSVPRWLPDGSGFLWSTERRGDWQLELRGRHGELVRELTPVGFHYNGLVDVDQKAGDVVVSGGPDPREVHLFRVPLKGGAPQPLTSGTGVHAGRFSRDHSVWVHSYAMLDGRAGSEVRRRDGKVLAELPSIAEPLPFPPRIELTRVTAGERTFDASIIRPRDFQPGRKYPVILYVYAGPGVKTVMAAVQKSLREHWMADHGYVVVSLDGRGTPGHGREWERVIRGNLIDVALQDQVDGLKALGEKYPELDLSRVGVTGWSFGGYFTAMAILRRPDIFRVGVSGAPVTEWENYDTHYTERYMDLPAANPEGYKAASVLTYAAQLERPLLLIHGLTDDNVYFVHTLKLAGALFEAGRPYDLLPLTGTHMVADPVQTLRLNARVIDYLSRSLGQPERYSGPAGALP